jgi:hypothetical protein
VMGGSRRDRIRKYPYRLTILILSRGDRLFRAQMLRETEALGLGEILWVEGPDAPFDLESLSREFPEVRFLLVKEPVTNGEMINIGVGEARAPLVLCLWSDTRVSSISASLLDSVEKGHAVCTVPLIRNSRSEVVPSFQSPHLSKGRLSLQFHTPRADREKVLFPFDYAGIYMKERFAQVGGFDPQMANPYWQKLDFGFRCFLWGEKIRGATALTLVYSSPPPAEDATPDESYKVFYLKNMAVRFRREMGMLPAGRIFEYMIHSNTGPLYAVREFRAARDWVSVHRSRFRIDPRDLIDTWGAV